MRASTSLPCGVMLRASQSRPRYAGRSTSRLSRLLFTGRDSLKRKLAQVNEPRLLLLRHSDLQGLGDGTTACVTDTKAVTQIPQRPTDIPGFWTSNSLLCVFFVHADNRWYVSYGFAEGPEPALHADRAKGSARRACLRIHGARHLLPSGSARTRRRSTTTLQRRLDLRGTSRSAVAAR
jgi:hypothetical protein